MLSRSFHSVYLYLIAATIIVFAVVRFQPGYAQLLYFSSWTFLSGFYWTPITYGFVNPDVVTFLSALLILIFLVPAVERMMGSWHFLFMYSLSLVMLPLLLLVLRLPFPVAGSSATVYAMLLAIGLFFPSQRVLFFFVIPVNVRLLYVAYAAYQIILAAMYGHFFTLLPLIAGSVSCALYIKLALKVPLKPFFATRL